jgi:hypothetical protein
MATLIRLKQIESGSALQTSAAIGTDFSQSVIAIVQGNIAATLPDGIISSSVQVNILQTTNFAGFSSSINTQISASSANTLNISSSVNTRLTNLESFSSSLDNSFATDIELYQTSSQIIDQGEW